MRFKRRLSISVIAPSSRRVSFLLYVSSRGRMTRVPISPHLGLETAGSLAWIPPAAIFVVSFMPTMIGVPVAVLSIMIPPPIVDRLDII